MPSPTMSDAVDPRIAGLLRAVEPMARSAGVFESVKIDGGVLDCAAKDCPEPAFYRLGWEQGRLWVSLATPHRYLSQSIEADLVHTGDKMQDLVQDELIDHGYTGGCGPVEHFRSEAKLFTFRTVVPITAAQASEAGSATVARSFLLAFEACFRHLGDMSAGSEQE